MKKEKRSIKTSFVQRKEKESQKRAKKFSTDSQDL